MTPAAGGKRNFQILSEDMQRSQRRVTQEKTGAGQNGGSRIRRKQQPQQTPVQPMGDARQHRMALKSVAE